MASVNGNSNGWCVDLRVEQRCKNCGLENALMNVCFNDYDVTGKGGFNPLTDTTWKDTRYKTRARVHCRLLVYAPCQNDDLCLAIFDAAVSSGFDVMFVALTRGLQDHLAIDILNAMCLFRGVPLMPGAQGVGSEKFLKTYGPKWFFCKSYCSDFLNCDINHQSKAETYLILSITAQKCLWD